MRLSAKGWALLSAMLFLLAGVLLWKADRVQQAKREAGAGAVHSEPINSPAPEPRPAVAPQAKSETTNRFPFRLSNSTEKPFDLFKKPSAILLENAFIDSAAPASVDVPAVLRSNPQLNRSFIVQARGATDKTFREAIAAAGGRVVSYIPNNAYLIRADAGVEARLASHPRVQAVVPFEPYYKIQPKLMSAANGQGTLAAGSALSVTLFPDTASSGRAAVEALGLKIIREESSPFGRRLVVTAASMDVAAIARIDAVQSIENAPSRKLANDLTRFRLRVTTNVIATNNWLDLTGTNVLVAVSDSGVDATHPDLAGRVTGENAAVLTDVEGHGTHVAGIIASSGRNSPPATNAPGSTDGANFRGMAPAARLHVLAVDRVSGPLVSDEYLQSSVALTNALISNNSWGYLQTFEYDGSAASFDAAVRDSLPEISGSQPVLFVFAAGNEGAGNDNGTFGTADSITSPGTAKNVITVGALEQLRNITNEFIQGNVTNQLFLPRTDSDNQVAGYSSRGNVGEGTEGAFGRFKPDLVAPGTFVLSTRPTNFLNAAAGGIFGGGTPGFNVSLHENVRIQPGATNYFTLNIPTTPPTVGIVLQVIPNADSPLRIPPLVFVADVGYPPSTYRGTNFAVIVPSPFPPGLVDYGIGNTNAVPVSVNIRAIVVTSDGFGGITALLDQIDAPVKPYYGFDSGTSVAAPAVSGMIALMQEFFEQKLPAAVRRTNSPAMMKALLVNGSRSASPFYDYRTTSRMNHQGWGIPRLTNSVREAMLSANEATWPVRMFDQSPTTALATGDGFSRQVTVSDTAAGRPLRFTLVWTDPPGNPRAGIKLVNDLDLVVTNLSTMEVYYGNVFGGGSDFSAVVDTNVIVSADSVNNVENIFIAPPLGTNYAVAVIGRRVNVNAVTAHPDDVVQDFALVISTDDGAASSMAVTPQPASFFPGPKLTVLTNGVPLTSQRVGASSPLIGSFPGNGQTNQWRFFVFTNLTTDGGTNLLIRTFFPPNLSRPRASDEADIDLYLSTDPSLTNLSPAALAGAFKSLRRGGEESIPIIGAAVDTSYYIGVKSEDQQASEFSIFASASNEPFFDRDDTGVTLRPRPALPLNIPDGSSDQPGSVVVFYVAPGLQERIQRVVVTNEFTHELFGDLFNELRIVDPARGSAFSVLNNHSFGFNTGSGFRRLVQDDTGILDNLFARPTDGPGSLLDFVTFSAASDFQLTLVDNSLNHTGRVEFSRIKLFLQPTNTDQFTFIAPPGWSPAYLKDVGPEADRLDTTITYVGAAQNQAPVILYVRRDAVPQLNAYDKVQAIQPPLGGTLSIGRTDSPPLGVGTYVARIFNPNPFPVPLRLRFFVNLAADGTRLSQMGRTNSTVVIDDALSRSTLTLTNVERIAAIQLQLDLTHPRISDLAVTLISPSGDRSLVLENRGGADINGFRGVLTDTNYLPTFLGYAPFYEIRTNQTIVTNVLLKTGFEDMPVKAYTINQTISGRWLVETGSVDVAGMGRGLIGPSYEGTNAVDLIGNAGEQGTILANLSTIPGTNYSLTFAYALSSELTNAPPIPSPQAAVWIEGTVFTNTFSSVSSNWVVLTNSFTASNIVSKLRFKSLVPFTANSGVFIDAVEVRSVFTNITISTNIVYPPITNTVVEPIKFALPPFTNGLFPFVVRTSLTNGFEPGQLATNGIYVAVTNIGGWQVTDGEARVESLIATGTNNVFAVPAIPDGGVQFLSLNGQLNSRIITNTALRAGTEYRVRFAYSRDPLSVVLSNTVPVIRLNAGPDPLLVVPASVTNRGNSMVWGRTSVVFRATANSTNLAFQAIAATTNGFLLDSVVLEELPNNPDRVFLAEERFSPFIGQTAFGDWSLEVRDTRVGGGAVPAVINEWSLRFIYQPTDFGAVVLTNDSRVTNIVRGAEVRYFAVETPFVASWATNELRSINGGQLDLVFNQNALPGQGLPGDFTLLSAVGVPGTGISVLGTNVNVSPFFLPGQRYYLAVSNVNPNATSTFSLHIQFDRLPTNSTVLPVLTNGFTVSTNIDPSALIHYYAVDISTNAIGAVFEVLNPSGDVDLVVRNDLPLPNPVNFQLIGANPGTDYERIVVTSNSLPIQVRSGRWYLGVYNLTSSNVTYGVRVTEEYAFAVTNVVDLVLDTPQPAVATPGAAVTNFYRLRLTNAVSAILFEINNPSGNVDLVMRRDALPSLVNYDSISRQLTNISDQIIVRTNAFLTDLRGDWYLAVPNNETNNVAFSIRASVSTNGILQSANPATTNILANGVPLTITVPPSILVTNYFQFTVTDTNAALYFEVYNMTGDVDLLIGKGGIPSASLNSLSAHSGTVNEFVLIRTNSAILAETVIFPDLNGSWLLAVPNYDVNAVTFTIRATTSNPVGLVVPGAPMILMPQIDLAAGTYTLTFNTIPGEHYRVDTSTDLVTWTIGVVPPGIVTAPGSTTSIVLNLALPPAPSFFYRIVQVP